MKETIRRLAAEAYLACSEAIARGEAICIISPNDVGVSAAIAAAKQAQIIYANLLAYYRN